MNNLLSLVGDIVRVQAVTSNATRGFPVEDTAAMVFTFANGALGTFLLSDTAASPRSLGADLAGEHRATTATRTRTATTSPAPRGSLSVPTMRLKVYPGARVVVGAVRHSTVETVERSDPLANQIEHFAAVIRGEAEPICSGRDGLKTLRVVDAVARGRPHRPAGRHDGVTPP